MDDGERARKLDGWMHGKMDEWMSECMDERLDEMGPLVGLTGGWMEG